MRFIFLSVVLLLIFSCSRSDINSSEKEYNKTGTSYESKAKSNYNYFTLYEGQATYSITHLGLDREYTIYIPPSIESRTNLPVIFNFHGYQGQAYNFFNRTDLIDIADENGVVLVYPQGAPLDGGASHWNAAPLDSTNPSFVNKSNVNDLQFFLQLLEVVNQNNILDLNRVYAIGYSNGGMFSHFLACNTENVFAAIGDVAGTMLLDTFDTCNPSSPIPVLKIHGTSDRVVSYNGYDQEGFKSVDEVINFWKENNKSNNDGVLENLGSTTIYSEFFNTPVDVNFEKYTYESDENDSEIVHYKMIGGGHWWDYSLDENLKTSSLLWDFFSKHSNE